MRNRAYRRHQTNAHMMRRLNEDRNQHYNDLTCPCWDDPKARARFKEQPKMCNHWGCCNPRRGWGGIDARLTIQELKFLAVGVDSEENYEPNPS